MYQRIYNGFILNQRLSTIYTLQHTVINTGTSFELKLLIMESSRAESKMEMSSRFVVMPPIERKGYLAEQVTHHCCQCDLCVNDARPIPKIKHPRQVSVKQYTMGQSQAMDYVMGTLSSPQCILKIGLIFVIVQVWHYQTLGLPDTYVIADATLLYYSQANKKIRVKTNQTNLQIKKHFQEKRKRMRTISIQKSQQNASEVQAAKTKQIAILTYHDGTQQILNQTLLGIGFDYYRYHIVQAIGKILDKRKNDSSWQQISRIALIPPQAKQPLQIYRYHYERTLDTQPQLNEFMNRLAKDIDDVQENSTAEEYSGIRMGEDMPIIEEEYESQFYRDQSMRLSRMPPQMTSSLIKSRKGIQASMYFSYQMERNRDQQIKQASYEIVAYIQLVNKMRILNAKFQYVFDQRCTYLFKIIDFIVENLSPMQCTLIHDRYTPLEEAQLSEIADIKMSMDKKEEQNLERVCTSILANCLQLRKIELKLKEYHKPSQAQLKAIFMKIFPDFQAEKIFKNINWKNQLKSFTDKIKQTIDKVIRQDEGIRILKRFNIEFFRTFN